VIYDAERRRPDALARRPGRPGAHDAGALVHDRVEELLVPVLRRRPGGVPDDLAAARARCAADLAALSPRTRRTSTHSRIRSGSIRTCTSASSRSSRRPARRRHLVPSMTPVCPLFCSTASYAYLADPWSPARGRAATSSGRRFPDGEHYQRIDTDVADRDVSSSAARSTKPTRSSCTTWRAAMVTAGAIPPDLVIPFYGYSTMERAVRGGEIVTAKTRARLLSSIPAASRGTQVFLLDLHVAAIAHYFEGGIRPIHVYGKSLVIAAARRLGGDDFVLACTDAGRAKWVESLANDLGVPAAFVYKRRLDGATPRSPACRPRSRASAS
jgi:hypothetical protein